MLAVEIPKVKENTWIIFAVTKQILHFPYLIKGNSAPLDFNIGPSIRK